MIVPASHVAFLAMVYAFEYIYRAKSIPLRKYLYIGKAFGRIVLAGAYIWIAYFETTSPMRQGLVRWSLVVFLGIDLFFAAQEHLMRWYSNRHAR